MNVKVDMSLKDELEHEDEYEYDTVGRDMGQPDLQGVASCPWDSLWDKVWDSGTEFGTYLFLLFTLQPCRIQPSNQQPKAFIFSLRIKT